MYRRIAELRELEDLVALREELQDRYGPPPEAMRNLLYGVEVKLRASKAGATEVRVRGAELRIAMGRDIGEAQRRALLAVFPKAQHGQRQVRASIVDARGDWRDALTSVLEGLAA
jgi:transcription-repair coupling factor (superfamily II helicase)